MTLNWSKKKPKLTKEGILIIAYYWGGSYKYCLYEILKTDFEDWWYWGIFDSYGDEWGNYADLKADLYLTIPLLTKRNKK